jgi:uncharacterized protein YodC (DUF2158 family)
MKELHVGDVVTLNSGGGRMTVASVKPIHGEPENFEAQCHWFESDGCGGEKHEYTTFPIKMLTLVKSAVTTSA